MPTPPSRRSRTYSRALRQHNLHVAYTHVRVKTSHSYHSRIPVMSSFDLPKLPEELQAEILGHTDGRTLLHCMQVCAMLVVIADLKGTTLTTDTRPVRYCRIWSTATLSYSTSLN